MLELVEAELRFARMCVFFGFMAAMSYDSCRIARKVIKHKKCCIIIEDLLFGVIVSIFLVCINYKYNSGTIRMFVFVGIVLGILLYEKLFSNSVVILFSSFFIKIRKKILYVLRIVEKITINMVKRWKKISKIRKL